ncbi:hypothetical protein PABG_02760 [Paracoccidioides brasiliensis Pb03]|uniref:Uncharacterized protein n=1 Tax=Paracoccidioides brasiliensis (strain Pb18) TaxID=502780 RepID=C1G2T6_PARBD|nr:uncharacterized protein PADG_01252 [Paracoccidioides brasiliensis Pb18]EEH20529.2 hypothetical protein PABG_02760 [Paracoccidioides brasiliensis Pb03]EEH45102.1 hypothetical protein PADG_01252 [Paracoccidioides brasiliensis Pb18]
MNSIQFSPNLSQAGNLQGPDSPESSMHAGSTLTDPDVKIETPTERSLSTFERVFSTHAPIFESFLLQAPTDTIFQLYHTSRYLRSLLRSYPTAWQYLSFRLFYPSGTQTRLVSSWTELLSAQRQSYSLDQLLLQVILPFSPTLRSLDLDNTAVNGQNLTSTVLNMRRDTLEHLSVRGCKNVSLKYHIIPYLTMFKLQYDADLLHNPDNPTPTKRLALKSLYAYRCRHHRRRPYLSSSLLRRDSDADPTHDFVTLCHTLGIWTDTAWCTTPGWRCFRRKGYVSSRSPQGTREVWVVFDRLWRSKNWIGAINERDGRTSKRDGRLWEHDETGCFGEALGTADGPEYGEGKTVPTHLRKSHTRFVNNITCDECDELILERCEQCSVLMHCVGCRRTLCYSCAFDRPYPRRKPREGATSEHLWWAPGTAISPCAMLDEQALNNQPPAGFIYPSLKFYWCCTEPSFSGGGGISLGIANRDVDRLRATPLPRGQGWEDLEFSTNEWLKTFPKDAYGNPPDHSRPEGHAEMMRWLLGPPDYQASICPRNLCQQCYDRPQWKVHCKGCTMPLCMEHDLRGLRLRICGYRDLVMEKMDLAITASSPGEGQAEAHVQNTPSPADPGQPSTTRGRPVAEYSTSSPRFNLAMINALSSQLSDASISTSEPVPTHITPSNQRTIHQSSMIQTPSSTSNNHSRSSSPASVYFEASPEVRKRWMGCQSIFCPQYRAVGDQRQRCSSVLRECTSCSVHVCQDCIQENPPCSCSYCNLNYMCPNCYLAKELDGTCRRIEEERIQREEKQKRDLEMIEIAMERNLANEVALFAGQFFVGLLRNIGEHEAEGLGSDSDGEDGEDDEGDDDDYDDVAGSDSASQNLTSAPSGDNNNGDGNIQTQNFNPTHPSSQLHVPQPGPAINDDYDDNGSVSEETELLGE